VNEATNHEIWNPSETRSITYNAPAPLDYSAADADVHLEGFVGAQMVAQACRNGPLLTKHSIKAYCYTAEVSISLTAHRKSPARPGYSYRAFAIAGYPEHNS
jgi:hypothetical protein